MERKKWIRTQVMVTKILVFSFLFTFCFNSYAQNSVKDNLVGTSITIQSTILNDEREVQVFLPEGYDETDAEYPVLYILDGQRYFLHGVSLQKSFVEFKQTPQYIIVGISSNPSDRNRNYSVNSQNYLEFIKNEIIAYVDGEFRTTNRRILFGWAYGGGFVIETMIREADLFDVFIAASPFPLLEKISSIDSLINDTPDFNKLLFFTSGTDEGVVKEGTGKLNILLTNKAPSTMNWVFKELEGEEHRSTPFTTLYHGLSHSFSYYPELQFNSNQEFSIAGGLDYVYYYYQQRALRYGFPNELSDWTMFSITRNAIRANDYDKFDIFVSTFEKTEFISRLRVSRSCSIAEYYLENNQFEKALELFTMLAEKNPTNARPLIGLGDTYKGLKKNRRASIYYKKAKKLSEK